MIASLEAYNRYNRYAYNAYNAYNRYAICPAGQFRVNF